MNKQQYIFDVLTHRRSIRKFTKKQKIDQGSLKRIFMAAQFAPNACNLQAIEYILVKSRDRKDKLSKCIGLANNLNKKKKNHNTPASYAVVLLNKKPLEELQRKSKLSAISLLNAHYTSVGCSLSNMVNQAYAEGLGSCIVMAIDEKKIKENLKIDDKYIVVALVMLGYPKEKPIANLIRDDVSTKYYLNSKGVLVVPKKKPTIKLL